MFFAEYLFSISLRPFCPAVSSSSSVMDMKRVMALTSGLVPISIHAPHLLAFKSCHGVPVVVITGVPEARASAMARPKFSEWVGSTKKSEVRNSSHFLSPYTPPMRLIISQHLYNPLHPQKSYLL